MDNINLFDFITLTAVERKNFTGTVSGGSNYKAYYQNGQIHREDGPAIKYGYDKKAWFYYGKEVNVNSQEEFEAYLKVVAFE